QRPPAPPRDPADHPGGARLVRRRGRRSGSRRCRRRRRQGMALGSAAVSRRIRRGPGGRGARARGPSCPAGEADEVLNDEDTHAARLAAAGPNKRRGFMRRTIQICLFALLVGALAVPAVAQTATATIRGKVTNEQQAALGGATIHATGTASGFV